MLLNFVIIFLIAFVTGLISLLVFKQAALKADIFTSARVPVVGGVSVFLAFLASCGFGVWRTGEVSPQTAAIIGASFLVFFAGSWEDHKKIPLSFRVTVQLLAVFLLVTWEVRTRIAGIGEISNILITLVWIFTVTNSFKLLDQIDGLGAGIAAISSLTLFVISVFHRDFITALPALSLCAASLSLFFNSSACPRLGNTGSYLPGFLLSALAINVSYAPVERRVALFTPFLILALPLSAALYSGGVWFYNRYRHPADPGANLFLRILGMGYPPKKVLSAALFLSGLFCVTALLVGASSNAQGVLVIITAVFLSFLAIRKMAQG